MTPLDRPAMRIRWRLAAVALLCALAWAVSNAAPAHAQTGIAAIVNDDVISHRDLKERTDLVIATSNLEDRPEVRQRIAREVLRSLVNEHLRRQEARRLGIRVTPEDLDGGLSRVARQLGIGANALPGFLSARGINPQTLIDQIEADIGWVKTIRARMNNELRVSTEDIDDTIARIEAEVGTPEYRVAEILLPVDSRTTGDEALQFAERLLDQLRSGARFAVLARNFSQSASAPVGGDLGWVRAGELGPEIDAVITKLEPNEVSSPIRSPAGYHLLLMIDRRKARGFETPAVRVTLHQLYIPLSSRPTDDEIATQTALARTTRDAAQSCDDFDALGKELGSPLSGKIGTVELNDLPPHLRDQVRPLAVGQATEPIPSGNAIVVLMVCGRDAPTVADEQKRRRVESMLRNQRLAAASRRYLRDLRRDAFVDVRL